MSMNWEKFECDDEQCQATHCRYFDEETDEVVGMVSGPTRLKGFIVDYKGETAGEYRNSVAAMRALEQMHEQETAKPKDDPSQDLRDMVKRFNELWPDLTGARS